MAADGRSAILRRTGFTYAAINPCRGGRIAPSITNRHTSKSTRTNSSQDQQRYSSGAAVTGNKYVPAEDDFLCENYRIIGPSECAIHLGRSKKSVGARASLLGLTSYRTIRKPMRDAELKQKAVGYKTRRCLRCQNPFQAMHRHNFICPNHGAANE